MSERKLRERRRWPRGKWGEKRGVREGERERGEGGREGEGEREKTSGGKKERREGVTE